MTTSLAVKDLSHYTNVKVFFTEENEGNEDGKGWLRVDRAENKE